MWGLIQAFGANSAAIELKSERLKDSEPEIEEHRSEFEDYDQNEQLGICTGELKKIVRAVDRA